MTTKKGLSPIVKKIKIPRHWLLLCCLLCFGMPAFSQGQGVIPSAGNVLLRICPGDTAFLTIDTSLNNVPVSHYDWYHNDSLIFTGTASRLAVQDTGTYHVVAYSSAGCSSPNSNIITVRWKQLLALNNEVYTDPYTKVNISYLSNDIAACAPITSTITHIVSGPQHGQLGPGAAYGIYTYTPDYGFAGVDSFFYYLTDSNGVNSNTARVLINVGDASDTSGKAHHESAAYPNPVSDFVYIKGDPSKMLMIVVIDEHGRVRLRKFSPNDNITAIDMRGLQAAVYFVRIIYKDHTSQYIKILKAK